MANNRVVIVSLVAAVAALASLLLGAHPASAFPTNYENQFFAAVDGEDGPSDGSTNNEDNTDGEANPGAVNGGDSIEITVGEGNTGGNGTGGD
ncbi:MAG: hypothetical protein ACRDJH_18780, partial [Thermomicrobiales bacterium]